MDRSSTDCARRHAMLAGIAAFLIGMPLLTPRIFVGPLRHWDEAWYAQVSREMLDVGDWLTPRWNGEPWFHKPPLAFWGAMASFSAFGVSEASARFFSALCGSLTLAVISTFVAHQFGFLFGLLASLLILAIPEYPRYVGRGQLDGPIALFVSLHLLCFWFARTNPRWHWAAGVCFGLAVLTKGAAAGLAFVVIGAFSVSMRDFGWLKQRSFWGGIAAALAICMPWHVHQLVTHGEQFLHEYGARHFLQFFDRIPGEDTPGPPWDYYVQFLLKSPPWGWALLTLGIAAAVAVATSREPLLRFSAAWTIAIPVALSFARTKWMWYLTPMYPGAVLFAIVAFRSNVAVRFAKGRPFAVRKATMFFAERKAAIGIAGLLAVAVACEPFVLGPKEGEAEIKALAPLVQKEVAPDHCLHTLQLGRVRRSVFPIATLYYTQRRTYPIHSWDEFQRVATGDRRCFHLLVREAELDALAAHLPFGELQMERLGAAGDVALVRIRSGRAECVSDRSRPEQSTPLSAN